MPVISRESIKNYKIKSRSRSSTYCWRLKRFEEYRGGRVARVRTFQFYQNTHRTRKEKKRETRSSISSSSIASIVILVISKKHSSRGRHILEELEKGKIKDDSARYAERPDIHTARNLSIVNSSHRDIAPLTIHFY